jgi:hypothetical protein
VLRLGEIGIAAQKDTAKTAAQAGIDRTIQGVGGTFVRGTITGPIHDS